MVVDPTAGGRCNLRTRRQGGGGRVVLLKEQEHKISIDFRLSDGGKRKMPVQKITHMIMVYTEMLVEVRNILKS